MEEKIVGLVLVCVKYISIAIGFSFICKYLVEAIKVGISSLSLKEIEGKENLVILLITFAELCLILFFILMVK